MKAVGMQCVGDRLSVIVTERRKTAERRWHFVSVLDAACERRISAVPGLQRVMYFQRQLVSQHMNWIALNSSVNRWIEVHKLRTNRPSFTAVNQYEVVETLDASSKWVDFRLVQVSSVHCMCSEQALADSPNLDLPQRRIGTGQVVLYR